MYSEHEFDLGRLAHLRDQLIEVGRSCVHRDFRSGAVIALLWSCLLYTSDAADDQAPV
nr:GNAT family N-acetyltransferase [Chromobacterium sp. ASV5]